MTKTFQVSNSGDLEKLGKLEKDPYTGKDVCRCVFDVDGSHALKLEYASAVVYGAPKGDIDLDAYGEVGYELNGKTFGHTVQFVQSVQNEHAIGQTSQSLVLYVPAGAKVYFKIPLFSSAGGANGGGRVALTGTYV